MLITAVLAPLAGLAWHSTAQADEHRQTGTWSDGGQLRIDRVGQYSATRLDDGRVLLVGGSEAPQSAEAWDPETRASRLVAQPISGREGHTATRLDSGDVLLVGGEDTGATEIYDPDTDEWTAVGPLAQERPSSPASVRLDDGRVLVTGGWHDGAVRGAGAEVYDPESREWTAAGAMQYGREGHTITRLGDGRVLVTGGYGNPAPPTHDEGDAGISDVAADDVAARQAEAAQSFTFTIADSDLGAGERVTIDLDAPHQADVDYTDDDAVWDSEHGDASVTVDESAAELTLTAGETIAAGTEVTIEGDGGALATDADHAAWYEVEFTREDTGHRQATSFLVGPTALDSAEVFDPDSGTWHVVEPMDTARGESAGARAHRAVSLGDDSVMVVGGTDETPAAEFFDPGPEPGDGSWQACADGSAAPDCPEAVSDPTVSRLPDGSILVTGSGAAMAQRFDPAAGEWWDAAAPSSAGSTATVLDNGHAFLAQGGAAQVYSPETVPAPVVDAISPTTGSVAGGFEVTITGQHLDETWFVRFGDSHAGETTQISDEEVRVVAPPHQPQSDVPVTVSTSGGTSEPVEAAELTYVSDDGQWEPTDTMVLSRAEAGSALLEGPGCERAEAPDHCGKVLVVGDSSSELYDPTTETFGSLTVLPVAIRPTSPTETTLSLDGPDCRDEAPAAYCGRVLIVSGDGTSALYDPEDNTWRSCSEEDAGPECPGPVSAEREIHRAVLIDGAQCRVPEGSAPDHCGNVMVTTTHGGGQSDPPPPEAYLYDPATGGWSQAPSANEPRASHVMTLIDGEVCERDDPPDACGNVMISSGAALVPGAAIRTQTAELFDPATGRWRETGEQPGAGRRFSSATSLPDGRVVVAGGHLDYVGQIDDVDIFDPVDESWEPMRLPQPRRQHSSTLLPDGRVMLVGGHLEHAGGSEGPTSSVVIFDPTRGDRGEWSYTASLERPRWSGRVHGIDRFALQVLADGRVLVAGGRGRDEEGDVEALASAELYTAEPGRLAGEVVDSGSGEPLQDADVTVTDADGDAAASTTTGHDGTYGVNDLVYGEYTVTVEAAGHEPASENVTVRAAATTTVDFALDVRPGAVAGQVTDAASGEPVSGADVTLADDGEAVVTAGTRTDGTYEATGLPPGDYELAVEAVGYRDATQDVAVEPGEVTTVDVALTPLDDSGRLEGVVTDADTDEALAGVDVAVLDDTGEEVVAAGTDRDGVYWVEPLPAGDYRLQVSADHYVAASRDVTIAVGTTTTADFALDPEATPPIGGPEGTTRVAGDNRFDTAARLSARAYPDGAEVAYVATGLGFADALTGGVAAALDRGPVLLTATSSVPAATAAELERLDLDRVVLLGGSAVVDAEVETALGAYAQTVERLSGPDRFATATEIAGTAFPDGADTVYLATGGQFPDALAAVSAAADAGAPLLLAAEDELTDATETELARLDPDRIVLLGGTAALSDTVASLAGEFADTVDRLEGATRFHTAAAIAEHAFPEADEVFVATGLDFPDALAGGAVAGTQQTPVMLSATDDLTDATRAALSTLSPRSALLLGGSAALAPEVGDQLDAIVGPGS